MLKNFALFNAYRLKCKVNEKVCPTCASQKKVYEKVYQKMSRNNLSLLILLIPIFFCTFLGLNVISKCFVFNLILSLHTREAFIHLGKKYVDVRKEKKAEDVLFLYSHRE